MDPRSRLLWSLARGFRTSATTSVGQLPEKLTAVHRGQLFEARSHAILRAQMSMALARVGGKSDGGIDLLGWWWLPPSSSSSSTSSGYPMLSGRRRLRVLGQCKAERLKLGPHYVREMEGVALSLSAKSTPADTVALLVSESGFTRGGLERARESRVPFFLLHLPSRQVPPEAPDAVGGCIWNAALATLLGPEFEVRWERSVDPVEHSRPGLWWKGDRLKSWTPDESDEQEYKP